MPVLKFDIHFGDDVKNAEITFDYYGRRAYQLLIDRYHQGYFRFHNGRWEAELAPKNWLQSEDIAIIGAIIEANYLKFDHE